MTTHRRARVNLFYVLALLAAVVLAAFAGYRFAPRAEASAGAFTVPAAVGVEAFPGARVIRSGSGTFRVPEQAPPGDYLVTPSGSVLNCTWKLLTKNDDKPKSLIAAGAPNRGASDEVLIGPSARFLVLLGDCTWSEVTS
jgi:hypothetical protein